MSEAENQVDTEIYDRARAGDEKAFELLVQSYEPRLYAYLKKNDPRLPEDAIKDIVQVTAYEMHKDSNPARWQSVERFTAQAFTIAENNLLDVIRYGEAKKRRLPTTSLLGDVAATGTSFSRLIERREEAEILEKTIDELDLFDRGVLKLRGLQGKKFQDVATELGISEGCAVMRYYRALPRLGRKLVDKFPQHFGSRSVNF